MFLAAPVSTRSLSQVYGVHHFAFANNTLQPLIGVPLLTLKETTVLQDESLSSRVAFLSRQELTPGTQDCCAKSALEAANSQSTFLCVGPSS